MIYQIVWQRALFAVYGINAESVAVVVSAFMLGLGLGSLACGWLSTRFPRQAIALFGLAELGVASFGLASLRIFHWAAAYSAGANLPMTVVFTLSLLIFPTMLMGATLPLLAEHLVRSSGQVGYSVAWLYFMNTFGSAVACYLCAMFLLRDFGQSGSVRIAAGINALVGLSVLLFARSKHEASEATHPIHSTVPAEKMVLRLSSAMAIAGVSGFIALGLEIEWFRVFTLASHDRAPAFALLLSTYLAGIAAGSYISEKATERKDPKTVLKVIGVLMLLAGAISPYLPPLVAFLKWKDLPFLISAPAFFLTAALLGSVLPLLCRLAVSADGRVGSGVSFIFVANILGSTLGSLVIGFVVLQRFGLGQVALGLGAGAVIAGGVIIFAAPVAGRTARASEFATVLAALAALSFVPMSYSRLYEKLIFGMFPAPGTPFAHVVENRNGVIAVTQHGQVFGSGVYDGYFNIDPNHDVNMIVRAYAVSAFHPSPKRMLMIGLSSGSWAQVLVNHPQTESLDIVEINPGYPRLISEYPAVSSLLHNPKVRIFIDDGRRWLMAHPDARYDLIVQNTSFYWRDHSSDLLSTDYLRIIRPHLNPGGVYYFNTTGSDDVLATGLSVFPYGLRVLNFLAVSDSPLQFSKDRWMSVLSLYKIDNRAVFSPSSSASQSTLVNYMALADSLNRPGAASQMESSDSLNARLVRPEIITDDNMGWEWRQVNEIR